MTAVKVKLDPDSYKAGYQAGYSRKKPAAPASHDDLGWYSGYIEGKADSYHGRRNRMLPVPAEMAGVFDSVVKNEPPQEEMPRTAGGKVADEKRGPDLKYNNRGRG